jgi:hypothetical protein
MTTPLLTRDEAAAYIRERHKLRCTAGYLGKLACLGGGPLYRRLDNRWALYDPADLDVWAASRISAPVRKAADGEKPRSAA